MQHIIAEPQMRWMLQYVEIKCTLNTCLKLSQLMSGWCKTSGNDLPTDQPQRKPVGQLC